MQTWWLGQQGVWKTCSRWLPSRYLGDIDWWPGSCPEIDELLASSADWRYYGSKTSLLWKRDEYGSTCQVRW